jgi:hypothetical protein
MPHAHAAVKKSRREWMLNIQALALELAHNISSKHPFAPFDRICHSKSHNFMRELLKSWFWEVVSPHCRSRV